MEQQKEKKDEDGRGGEGWGEANLVVGLTMVLTVALVVLLPNEVIVHWGAASLAGGSSSSSLCVFFFSFFSSLLCFLFFFLFICPRPLLHLCFSPFFIPCFLPFLFFFVPFHPLIFLLFFHVSFSSPFSSLGEGVFIRGKGGESHPTLVQSSRTSKVVGWPLGSRPQGLSPLPLSSWW